MVVEEEEEEEERLYLHLEMYSRMSVRIPISDKFSHELSSY
jgi:hypothetical protein